MPEHREGRGCGNFRKASRVRVWLRHHSVEAHIVAPIWMRRTPVDGGRSTSGAARNQRRRARCRLRRRRSLVTNRRGAPADRRGTWTGGVERCLTIRLPLGP